jgi:hypothetical protein
MEKPSDDTTCVLVDLKHEHYKGTKKWSGEVERLVEREKIGFEELHKAMKAKEDIKKTTNGE